MLSIRNDKKAIGGIWLGRTKRAYRRYIRKALPPDLIPDSDIAFVTYAYLPGETLEWIAEEIRKTAYFEHVIFQQASAAISSNCGPGTFGILYFLKSNKMYNIASYIDDDRRTEEIEDAEEIEDTEEPEDIQDELQAELQEMIPDEFPADAARQADTGEPESGEKWYEKLDCIDADVAIKNSGSEEAFRSVLEIFYNSIPDKHEELENYYVSCDWKNYTVKIHALKSSARLVGALELGDMAEALEMAGKGDNIQYIRENHGAVMDHYLSYQEALSPAFGNKDAGGREEADKPVADADLMASIYEELRDAADDMDCEKVETIMREIGEYSIPDPDKEKFERIREAAKMLDYDKILEALE
jgi:HPt (histidine-containing phosphotransfer) domain-containing protein